jgi:DNA-directed RNA polymerase subunit M/transcription elongation factor TFIIS
MSKHTQPRNRGGDSSNEENLRGKYREAKKEIKQLHAYVKYLEKKLRALEGINLNEDTKDDVDNTEEMDKARCRKCKSTNVTVLSIPRRSDTLNITICEDCGDRDSVKEK